MPYHTLIWKPAQITWPSNACWQALERNSPADQAPGDADQAPADANQAPADANQAPADANQALADANQAPESAACQIAPPPPDLHFQQTMVQESQPEPNPSRARGKGKGKDVGLSASLAPSFESLHLKCPPSWTGSSGSLPPGQHSPESSQAGHW